MIPELGHFALILALAMALAQSVLPLLGARTGNAAWMSLARPSARGQCLFVVIAYGCLTYAFISNDFSVLLAAEHSNSTLPLIYRITAVWGNHEGSILLWSLILSGWTLAVSYFSHQLDERMVARVLGVMGLISCGFLLFTLLTSNPFARLLPAAADGKDLNPLLQDPGMVIHPPMLYMGYVGFVVAFAFAIAALLSGRLDAAWARWSRPWTTVAWCFLTCGIALGSFWAYYELGWGGWWFWDPVENASFMPWLVGTALIHSLSVTEKRGGFKMWTALLAILTFSLSLLGTFIVRSGVLSSVHAFASDPARGIFILSFLALVIGGSLLLFAWRAPKVGLGGSDHQQHVVGQQHRFARHRLEAAGQQRAVGGRCRSGAAGHAVPAGARGAGHGQTLGRAALFRGSVRSADGACAVPDGGRPDGALAPSRRDRPGQAAALGLGRECGECADRSVRVGSLDADDRLRPAAGGLGRQHRRTQSRDARSRAPCAGA
jgi:cytochrome c biogenesis factor